MAKMRKRMKAAKPTKPPRNPFAQALAGGLFRARVVKRRDAYLRRPRHRKPPEWEGSEQ
jgi:hypothetical protein